MNPVIGSLVLVAGILIVCIPRRWAPVPFILVGPLVPPGQFFEIGPFHFYAMRLLLLFLCVRVLARSEYRFVKRSPLDLLILLQFACGAVAYIVLRGTSGAIVNRLGWLYDGLSIYFAMRWTIRDSPTWGRVMAALAFLCIVISVPMFIEQRTDRNLFSVFGGVAPYTEVRDGLVRSQGPFGHPILAGVFAANLVPLFFSLGWLDRRRRLIQVMGLTGAAIIVFTSSSSTPFMACTFGLLSLLAFLIRKNMRAVRWSIVALLVLLQCVMHNPVWAIIAKFKIFGGSTGYYRFWLLDNFIRRFWEWWLLGVKSTATWGPGLWDVTMMYVRVGVDGGLLTLVLFLAVIVRSYKQIGSMVIRTQDSPRTQKCIWALGAALTGHLAGFFGVNYWDQNIVPWYLLLAIIAGSGEIFADKTSDGAARSTSPVQVDSSFVDRWRTSSTYKPACVASAFYAAKNGSHRSSP